MLRLYLRDVETGVTVKAPDAGKDALLLKWSMKDAVGEMINKLAEKLEKSPQEILFSDRAPYEIYATWEEES